jgi:phosphonate metabolism protein (transferase hexapeptide repeat family)
MGIQTTSGAVVHASRDGRPKVHASADVRDCELGLFTSIGERVQIAECELGDYSYLSRHSEAIYTRIGKFCAIAPDVRLNALTHPMERVCQHNITYRPNEYFAHAKIDKDFRERRKSTRVVIGHDVWIGHGAIVMPGVTIGCGAVIGAGAVVTRDVPDYAVVAGSPAKRLKWRFAPEIGAALKQIAWWDFDREKLQAAIPDMQALGVEDFIAKYK